MPPPLILSLDHIDLACTRLSRDRIYELMPHRHEFMVLDGACHLDAGAGEIVTFADLTMEDWWVRGHVPGRPLLPGVLMLEMAGQTTAILAKQMAEIPSFIGFGGVESCKFREAVVPPVRILVLGKMVEMRRQRFTADTQGLVNGRMAFEARISGMAVR